ncbi:MAG: PAS domain-containing protein [Candidatus Riflebacteria bacterium]|nr:PAS domain-containing protein [Candidatus Riflebacteria bacterium]
MPHLSRQPALSVTAILQMLALVVDAPIAGVTEVSGDDCVLGAIHDRLGLGRVVGERTPRDQSPCGRVVLSGSPLMVHDALQEPRFGPSVAASGIRSYAGVPLSPPDQDAFGAVWVADVVPREFGDAALAVLMQLAPHLADGLLAAHQHYTDLRRYAHVMDSLREMVLLADLEGNIRYVNPAVTRVLGEHAGELIGQHFDRFGGGAMDPGQARQILARTVAGGFDGDIRLSTRDGLRTVRLRTSAIRDDDGYPCLLAGICHDITELLDVQSDLEQTSRQLQALYDASADGILMVDTENQVVVANRRFSELFGCDRDSCVGLRDEALRAQVRPCLRDPDEFERRVREIYGAPELEAEEELELVRPTPRVLQRYTGPVRGESGHVLGRLWIFRDVTTRRLMEQELRESQRLLEEKARLVAEADRLKSEFLATTSHDLRTPLNSMLGFLKLVLEDTCASREEEHSLLAHAYHAGTQLVGLLNDILDLAKIEAGNVPLDLVAVDAGKMFAEVDAIARVLAQEKGLEFTCGIADGAPTSVLSDPVRLHRVLLNLVVNAIKYTPAGSVRLGLRAIDGGARVRMTTADTGIGMDALTLMATRQGQFTSQGARGVGGLGLSIARRFVRLMGGALTFDSPGLHQGTCVDVDLPVARTVRGTGEGVAGQGVEPQGLTVPGAGAMHVLMVEDDPATSHAVCLALQRLGGFQVTVSEDVPTILDLAASGKIDAILMDVSLAHSYHQGRLIDGLEITRLLKTDSRSAHVPVVLMTAHAMAGDRERMLSQSGANDYEAKPILDFRLLIGKLGRLGREARAGAGRPRPPQ